MDGSLADPGIIPDYGDYTTVWNRIHDMKINLNICRLEYAEIGTASTRLKANNAGSYRIMKYGDPDAKKKEHLFVIMAADVRAKRVIGIEHI